MQPRKLALGVMPSLILLSGCAGTVVPDASAFCAAVQPVCIAKGDMLTKATAKRLVSNEYGRAAVCGVPKACEADKSEPPKVAAKQ